MGVNRPVLMRERHVCGSMLMSLWPLFTWYYSTRHWMTFPAQTIFYSSLRTSSTKDMPKWALTSGKNIFTSIYKAIKTSSLQMWDACLYSYLCFPNLLVSTISFNKKYCFTSPILLFVIVNNNASSWGVQTMIMFTSNIPTSSGKPRAAFQMENTVSRRNMILLQKPGVLTVTSLWRLVRGFWHPPSLPKILSILL